MYRTGTVCLNKGLSGYAADAQGSCVSWKFLLGNFVPPLSLFRRLGLPSDLGSKFDRINQRSLFKRRRNLDFYDSQLGLVLQGENMKIHRLLLFLLHLKINPENSIP